MAVKGDDRPPADRDRERVRLLQWAHPAGCEGMATPADLEAQGFVWTGAVGPHGSRLYERAVEADTEPPEAIPHS